MGPPVNTWPYSHTAVPHLPTDRRHAVDHYRVLCLNFVLAVLLCQVFMSFMSSVGAGPVVLNMDYMQGPVPLARNIRHLPCISRRTGQEGLCMFAIDCLKANGSHLGTCIDRFYFGSCCQIPDKTVIPQILTNHIDDNSIENANFVHPQTEDKIHNKIPEIFTTKKPTTTQKTVTTTREPTERTESLELETKSEEQTTIDNKIINDEKLTTAAAIETTTKKSEKNENPITELPIKLSTFQTVSGEISSVSIEKTTQDKTEVLETTVSSTTTTKKPTRKPVRPFTRPPYKPYNSTRPLYTISTFKPKPPIALYNTTRKPPYRPPPKRPSTKKPFPIPPRLNITILPQSTSSKPLLTRPSSVSITYINTTQTTNEEPKTTTTTTTTTTTLTTTTTTEKYTETTEALETTVLTTEAPAENTERVTTVSVIETLSTEGKTEAAINDIEKETTNQDSVKEPETTNDKETTEDNVTTNTDVKQTTPVINNETTEQYLDKETTIQDDKTLTTEQDVVTEKEIIKPATVGDIPITEGTSTSTDYPPLMTWTNAVETVTKAPEKVTEPSEEIWSPITPPEGWILLSTIKPETSTTTTTEAPTTQPLTTENQPETTTTRIIETTEKAVENPTETASDEPVLTTLSTTTTTEAPRTPAANETSTTQSVTTELTTQSSSSITTITQATTTQTLLEFTVNVTLSPTVPTSTSSVGLTTFTSVSTVDNSTKANETETTPASTVTEAPTTTTTEFSLESLGSDKNDYKKVCGRRLWQGPTARIVGGDKSGFGMWPWQISLRQYRTSTYLHKCGAALLNENWAITAAHCVEHVPPSELLVRLGEHDLATEDEPYGFAERRVQIVASHPHFDSATFEYDLALLRFYEPVKFQPNILPICVPDSDEDYVGKTAFVTGWGRLYDEGPLPSVLQEVKVPVINNSACEAMYQSAGYNEHIPHIFICAGRSKGGTDSCEGDSGGPMVIPRERDGRFVLSGIISWGIGCAEPNQPGVYTRISEFRDWINQILQF